jgi:hypothetical protein
MKPSLGNFGLTPSEHIAKASDLINSAMNLSEALSKLKSRCSDKLLTLRVITARAAQARAHMESAGESANLGPLRDLEAEIEIRWNNYMRDCGP